MRHEIKICLHWCRMFSLLGVGLDFSSTLQRVQRLMGHPAQQDWAQVPCSRPCEQWHRFPPSQEGRNIQSLTAPTPAGLLAGTLGSLLQTETPLLEELQNRAWHKPGLCY